MFNKKTHAEALERMVAFHTRAGNDSAVTDAQQELDKVQAEIAKAAEAAAEAAQVPSLEDAIEIPIEAPTTKKISKKKAE